MNEWLVCRRNTTAFKEKFNDYRVIFDDFVSNMPNRKILLDRILISPSLSNLVKESLVNHGIFNSVTTDINKRDGRPSDHRPISLSIDFI